MEDELNCSEFMEGPRCPQQRADCSLGWAVHMRAFLVTKTVDFFAGTNKVSQLHFMWCSRLEQSKLAAASNFLSNISIWRLFCQLPFA